MHVYISIELSPGTHVETSCTHGYSHARCLYLAAKKKGGERRLKGILTARFRHWWDSTNPLFAPSPCFLTAWHGHTHTHTHTHTLSLSHMHTYAYAHVCTHAPTYTRVSHTSVCTLAHPTHAHVHSHAHIQRCTHTPAHTNTSACIHTHGHACTHVHTHTFF